ncbi:MAG TPA: hypothetical protein VMS18_21395 [Candidatus Binatia bacterium]|nr:hypothetical protein [Candidatus Binatia bacterium]
MNRRYILGVLGMMVFALGFACAQNEAPSSEGSPAPQQPVPAYGQETTPSVPINENPPLSGLDLPSLQEHAAPLSYLQPGATFSESASTNIGNELGGSDFGSITRGLGTLELRRLWSHYDLALDYMGGVAYYNRHDLGWHQLQSLGIGQKIEWKRGQLSLRDNFSYLPEGNFGAPYGSLGSVGIAGIGSVPGSFWGGSALGAVGLASRILNVSLAELSESLSPKSTVTATAGYAFTHFFEEDLNGSSFIGSSQLSAQAGYNRILSTHTQIAAAYAYQDFNFSIDGTAFHSHVVQGMYGHRISGRMDLLLGAGPQITLIDAPSQVCTNPGISNPIDCLAAGDQIVTQVTRDTRLGLAAQARLRYRFQKSSVDLRYERFITSGGGLFAGAQTDIVRFGFDRPLSRVWSLVADLGFSHNDRLRPLTPEQITACLGGPQGSHNACPANDATRYVTGFAGAAIHRYFNRQLHGFLGYQFSELSFDHSYCLAGEPCDRTSNRHVITFGLDWTPRPIRID